MTRAIDSVTETIFIDAPRDDDLQALYKYWDTARAGRPMPSRQNIDPVQIPRLLPYIIMYDVASDGSGYMVRLVGEEVAQFVGRNSAGLPAGSFMTPAAAQVLIGILGAVATERKPKFRAGKAHWHPEKTFRDFEACFLPLSADGETVNIILGGVKFPL